MHWYQSLVTGTWIKINIAAHILNIKKKVRKGMVLVGTHQKRA